MLRSTTGVRGFWGVLGSMALMMLALTGCTSPAAPTPGDSGSSGDGAVQPKVNRVVWGLKAPPLEGANIRMVCCFDSFQYRPTHENLIGMDPVTGAYVPGLATEWKLDLDAKKVTFKLREGVNFHQPDKWGTMSSADVVHTYKTIVDNAENAAAPSFTWATSFWKRVVRSIDTPTPTEAVFNINPDVNFYLFMSPASHQMAIRSKKQQDAEGEPKSVEDPYPVGTGAYQWMERKTGNYVRFKRADYKHWNGTPDFPELELRFMTEPSTRMASLLAGEIHVTDLPSDLVGQAEKSGMKIVANRASGPRVWGQFRCCYVDPQTKQWPMHPDAPMLNIKVREALNRAINRDELGKAFAPKGTPMYLNHFHQTRQAWESTWEQRFKEKYGFDQARARQLLQEAGYGPGNPLKIEVMSVPLTYIAAGPDIAEAIAGYWRAVGVEPQIVSMDAATETAQQRAYRFTNTFRMQSASATLVDGINIFSIPANAPGSGYWTPESKQKLDELNGSLETSKQNELLKWIGDFGFNQYWDVPLWYVPLEVVVNPKIVSDFTFPGFVHGGWSHFETLKTAR